MRVARKSVGQEEKSFEDLHHKIGKRRPKVGGKVGIWYHC
jgi:hypothetical protein